MISQFIKDRRHITTQDSKSLSCNTRKVIGAIIRIKEDFKPNKGLNEEPLDSPIIIHVLL